MEIFDCLIIGGGPAGLYASFYAGLRDLNVAILEAQDHLGGKLHFYPEKMVWDVGAMPPTKGKQIQQNLIEQAQLFKPTIFLNTKIIHIEKQEALFQVTAQNGQKFLGKTILLCIGGGIYRPKMLQCSIDSAAQSRIYTHFPNPMLLKDKRLLVSGGGNSAIDYALEALNYQSKVSLCYRGAKLKAHEAQCKQFKQSGGEILLNHTIQTIQLVNQQLQITFTNQQTIYCDYLLVQHGYYHEADLLHQADLAFCLHEHMYLNCTQPGLTNQPGIFAAGDVQYFQGKLNLLAGAFQDAAYAINQIKVYLDCHSQPFAMVSSHNHKFDEKNQRLFQQASKPPEQ